MSAATDSFPSCRTAGGARVRALSVLRAAVVGGLLFVVAGAALAQTPPQNGAAAAVAGPATSPAAPNQAGVVVLVEGDARLAQGGAKPRAAKVGDVVSEGDLLITGRDGELHMTMQDTGFIALRPNTRFKVVSYKAEGGDDDGGIFRLVAGGFRSITGWIGKFNARGYQVRTPTATIGVRGTDHEPRYIPEGSTEGEAGTYDRVYAGQTYIETPAGEASVAPNQAGFASVRPRQRPQLLAAVPAFFRPGPHEAEIEKKHAEIQQQIDQRRQERRKAIAEKRVALAAAREQADAARQQNKAAAEQRKQAAQEEQRETREKREALQQDAKAATERSDGLREKRKALQEDVKSGRVTGAELRQRRKALQEEAEAVAQAQADVERRRRALQDATDARIDERFKATQERQQALHEQQLDVRGKRKALEAERDSTGAEIKTLQQQENRRYRDELKADRQRDNPAAPADGRQTTD